MLCEKIVLNILLVLLYYRIPVFARIMFGTFCRDRHHSVCVVLQAQELTGIALPKYYNPGAVNPLKYAEQIQKRKLLWSKPKDQKEASILRY